MNYQDIYTQAIAEGNNQLALAALEAAAQEDASIAIAKGMMILSMMAAAIGEGIAINAAFSAIGRNPKLEETLFSKTIIAVALVESTAIYAFVAFFLI